MVVLEMKYVKWSSRWRIVQSFSCHVILHKGFDNEQYDIVIVDTLNKGQGPLV